MDNQTYTDVVIKKSQLVRTLNDISCRVISSNKKLPVDSTVLFSRLLAIVQRSPDMEPYFAHELTAVPAALFTDAFTLRKSNKSTLGQELVKSGVVCEQLSPLPTFVIDGGWLLRKVRWQPGGCYIDVIQQYIKYVQSHYGSENYVLIVLDAYLNGPSTKDYEHCRHSKNAGPDILFADNMPVVGKQAAFLKNEKNKKAFVDRLMSEFKAHGYTVFQAANDADTLIVSCALNIVSSGRSVTVVATDIDVLVLLLYHYNNDMQPIHLHSETTKNRVPTVRITSIRQAAMALGQSCKKLLVAHAVSGCDTVSSLFGLGKVSIWKKMKADNSYDELVEIVCDADSAKSDIIASGLKLMTKLYGGNTEEGLNHLRYRLYMSMVSTSSVPPRPERLPPTESAAKYHMLRVHLQVVQWKYLMAVDKNPEEWGWKILDGHYMAVPTDIDPAPTDLLEFIKCKCSLNGKREPCTTQMCSCVRHNLPCLAACKHCCGELCANRKNDAGAGADDIVGDENLEEVDDEQTYWVAEHDTLSDDFESQASAPLECIMTQLPQIEEEKTFDVFEDDLCYDSLFINDDDNVVEEEVVCSVRRH
jgi:hypothetical protein